MKIICIGRNYSEHARELGNAIPEEPVFFLKPDSAMLINNQPFFYPDFSRDIHYETELVLKISRIGKNIEEKFAFKYYDEVGIGIDFTARDIQEECKKKGLPWEKAKGFDGSAAIGKFLPVNNFPDLKNIHFHGTLNGNTVQEGNSGNMLFSFDAIISYISKFFTLKIGDLVFTGTPAGVGPVKIDDTLECFIEGEKLLEVRIK